MANYFLGETITVAGLLAGADIAAQARAGKRGEFLVVPSEAVANADHVFIDGCTLSTVSEKIGVPVFESGLTVDSFFERFDRGGFCKAG